MHSHNQSEPLSQLPAGKFEFPDMGIYIGEWFESKAVGLGLMTREKGQGEFTGYWNNGKEECGVFLWPNAPGAMYEGDWAHSRRHGFGIFRKEDYIIMGEFKDDIIRTGISCREGTSTKFEGDFKEGLPVFGVETYPDGGTYCGEYESAKRHGYGKRTSIPYGEMLSHYPDEAVRWESRRRRDSLASQGSADMFPLFDSQHPEQANIHMTPLSGRRAIRSNAPLSQTKKFRCGFVLPGNKSDHLVERLRKADEKRARGKSHSLTSVISHKLNKSYSGTNPFRRRGGDGSFRSTYSIGTTNTIGSAGTGDWQAEDPIEPETVECYSGEWMNDERHGYGVCKRTDGVIYEGQWQHNLRQGYGVTHFPDGTVEAGRYHEGQLVFLAGKRNPLLFVYTFPINKQIEAAVRRAREAEKIVEEKYKEAQAKLSEVREKVLRAKASATAAREYSLETRELVKELYPHFEQPGIKILEATVKMMKVTKRISTAFETALSDSLAVLSGEHVFFHHDEEAHHHAQESKSHTHKSSDSGAAAMLKRSRHGSFRSSFRHNRRHVVGGEAIGGGGIDPTGTGVSRQAAIKVRQPVTKMRKKRSPHRHQNMLTVPNTEEDFIGGDDDTDTQRNAGNNYTLQPPQPAYQYQDEVDEEFIKPETYHSQKSSATPRIRHPGQMRTPPRELNGGPANLRHAATDSSSSEAEDDEDDEHGVSSTERLPDTPIIETVECDFPELRSKSDIPTVPFSQLLNSTVLSDYFDSYAVPGETEDSGTLPRPNLDISSAITFCHEQITAATLKGVSSPPPPFSAVSTAKKTIKSPVTASGGATSKKEPPEPTPLTKNSRTSTLPSLLTYKPVPLKPTATQQLKWGNEPRSPLHADMSSTDTLLGPNLSRPDAHIYMIQDGARKRLTPIPTSSSVSSKPTTSSKSPAVKTAPTPVSPPMKRRGHPTDTGPDLSEPTTALLPPQDKLMPLPKTYLVESQLDLKKDIGEGSLPDMSLWGRMQRDVGMSSTEAKRLVKAHKEQQKLDMLRRKQGELVISTTTIWDWCYSHRLLLLVFAVNVLLVYIFYAIVSHQPHLRPV